MTWHGGMNVTDRITVANQMTLRLGEYPGISRWAQDNYKKRKAKKKNHGDRFEGATLLALKMEEDAATAKKCRQPLGTGKGKGTSSFSPRASRRNAVLPAP